MTEENAWTAFCATLRLDELEREDLPPTRKRRKRRQPTLARMIKQARELGVDVVAAPDGSLILKCSAPTTTEPAAGNGAADNPWDEVLHAAH